VTYTTFSVAVSGEKDEATFFPVVVFGKLGETLTQYLTKGKAVLVEGRVRLSQKGRLSVMADQIQLGASPAAQADQAA
jgi:single-strand DNA-binding protein